MKSDVSDDSDDENNDVDVPARNKDICVLEIDDVEDLEIISLILEPGAPDGFHVVNTHSLPGLTDLEVVRNLQMFTQVWRAKFPTNQKVGAFPKHFLRLLQTIYFKLRSMIPCAICDLKFRLDLPEGVSLRSFEKPFFIYFYRNVLTVLSLPIFFEQDEFQILVNGIALGLSEPNKTKTKRKLMTNVQKHGTHCTDDELIFNLEEEHLTDLSHSSSFPAQAVSNSSSSTTPSCSTFRRQLLMQTGSLKLKKSKSPSRPIFRSMRLEKQLNVLTKIVL